MPGRTTIIQVAKALGVSPSTVSRAFNEPHRLMPSTVKRVREMAEELGYIPNRHARALITGRSGVIGLCVPDITNPFFPPMIRAAQKRAEQEGMVVYVTETDNDPDRERKLLATMRQQAESIIVASPRLPSEELRYIAEASKIVLINSDHSGLARVLISTADAITEAIHRFVDQGCRAITYVGGPRRSWSEYERRTTVEEICKKLGLASTSLAVESGTYYAARNMIDPILQTEPDAIVAFDDVIAHGVMHGIESRGLRIPDDILLVGCDDALPSQTRPQLSTIRLSTRRATNLAIDLLTDSSIPIDEVRQVLPGELIHRETTWRPSAVST